MPNRILIYFVLIVFSSFNQAYCDDPIARLDIAKSRYFAAEKEFDNTILSWFDTQEERARSRGDRESVLTIKAERAVYIDDGTLPHDAPQIALRNRRFAKLRLENEYNSVVASLTRAGNDREAGAAEKKLEFILDGSLANDVRSTWVHDSGLFKRTTPSTWMAITPNGSMNQFRETTRNKEFVEVETVGGDGKARVRLFESQAEVLVHSKEAETLTGSWVSPTNKGTNDTVGGLISGQVYRGKKTWTKLGAVRPVGHRESWMLEIRTVNDNAFTGFVKCAVRVEVSGTIQGDFITFTGPRLGKFHGFVLADRLIGGSDNGRLDLKLESAQ